jgi:hypothetical protein
MSTVNMTLTKEELKIAISALLFSCSINVVSNTHLDYQEHLLNLAQKLKKLDPELKLTDVQFVKEEDYEEAISERILKEFEPNIEIVSFDNI